MPSAFTTLSSRDYISKFLWKERICNVGALPTFSLRFFRNERLEGATGLRIYLPSTVFVGISKFNGGGGELIRGGGLGIEGIGGIGGIGGG